MAFKIKNKVSEYSKILEFEKEVLNKIDEVEKLKQELKNRKYNYLLKKHNYTDGQIIDRPMGSKITYKVMLTGITDDNFLEGKIVKLNTGEVTERKIFVDIEFEE